MEEFKITKDMVTWAIKNFPKLEARRLELERKHRKLNPFYPFRMTEELKEALIKWGKNEN